MNTKDILAKQILTPSKLPGADYVINPYSGCAFGCVYCYADFMRRFTGHTSDKWGEYVDVKVNAPELLRKEIGKIPPSSKILIGSVTDPYQGIEATRKITRQCLEVLVAAQYPGEVAVLTKSPLVARDIDLFKQLKQPNVGLTITSTDDSISRLLEKHAPTASARLRALKQLNENGIKTYVCVNPLLPHFAAHKEEMVKLFQAIEEAGTREVWIEHLNLTGATKHRLLEELKGKVDTSILEEFWFSQSEQYKKQLEELIYEILSTTKLHVLGGGILDHKKN